MAYHETRESDERGGGRRGGRGRAETEGCLKFKEGDATFAARCVSYRSERCSRKHDCGSHD